MLKLARESQPYLGIPKKLADNTPILMKKSFHKSSSIYSSTFAFPYPQSPCQNHDIILLQEGKPSLLNIALTPHEIKSFCVHIAETIYSLHLRKESKFHYPNCIKTMNNGDGIVCMFWGGS